MIPIWLIIAICILMIRVYLKFTIGVYKGNERLDGKIIVVTGANSGIGLIAAKDFARRGARVVMVCRDMEKAERAKSEIIKETGNDNISLKHINFGTLKSVRKCAREIVAEEPQIDVLLNNAGVSGMGDIITDDGIDLLMQTNYFAPFLFTNILLEKIKKSNSGRIVNVASILHNIASLNLNKLTNPGNTNLYATSKLVLIYFSNELARKLEGTGITVNSLQPGTFSSEIVRYRKSIIKFMWNYVLIVFFRTAEEAAQTSIYCCVSSEVANMTGKYFSECKLSKHSKKAGNMEIAKKIWDLSEDAVSLQESEKHYM